MRSTIFTQLMGCWLILSSLSVVSQPIPSPADFLGYELGEKFTYHHRISAYVEAVAESSGAVSALTYGSTYEGRPLQLVFITDPENMVKLDEIRNSNLQHAGLAEGDPASPQLPIVWLSYNVHGNEAVSSEAVMETLYLLATQQAAGSDVWLKDMVVILDPCLNPDGKDRYTNWYNQYQHSMVNPDPSAMEHREPWPGGRYNHYLFDLNRDWAWQTQVESQVRMKEYMRWMPQVHVDFHEMGPNSPYYFAPAAKPYHAIITPWQREFQELTGRNHAKYFDEEGWLYFTKEVFDLLYPSYGDTWPTFNGAIGFTYEQGGSGRAGVAVLTNTGDTLTLKDRITHHVTTGLSTIETAFDNKERMLREFNSFFSPTQKSLNSPYHTFVIPASNNSDKLLAITDLLDKQGITYGSASANTKTSGFDYQRREKISINIDQGDLLVPIEQKRGKMVQALFEPTTYLEDSITYDMTAWALPYVFGVEAYATDGKPTGSLAAFTAPTVSTPTPEGDPYAFIMGWEDQADVRFLAAAFQQGIRARQSTQAFTIGNDNFSRGSLIFLRTDNGNPSFQSDLLALANAHGRTLTPVYTGYVDEGKDFGSYRVAPLSAPKVGLIGGDGSNPLAMGELWHHFEQDLQYPITLLHTHYLNNVSLDEFDVILLPSGRYGDQMESLKSYVRGGGTLIALDRAVDGFTRMKEEGNTALAKSVEAAAAELGGGDPEEEIDPEIYLKVYDEQERNNLSDYVAGSIYRIELDETHPLAFGLGDHIHVVKRNSSVYPYFRSGGWNVGAYKPGAHTAGFTGHRLKKRLAHSLAIGVERMGSGQIIYLADSPTFRGFWHQGKLLLGNAVFLMN
ncbi:MAG: M14 metallopeptidase family protein [Bacteroidota bacterium]